jgi:guanylate kinase
MRIERRGFLLVLSSPSGAGKTTIARLLAQRDGNLHLSVSVTTRRRREGEVDGRDYLFIDRRRFDEMVAQGELLEHAIVFDNCYGTPRGPIEEALAAGHDVVGDLDWQGTQQLKESVREDLVSVFVLPPSRAELEMRLRARAQDSAAAVAARMAKAAEEMSHWPEYDYVIVNRDIEDSVAQVQAIVAAEKLRRERQLPLVDFGSVGIEVSVGEVQAIVTAEGLRREKQLGLEDFVSHLLAA